MALVWQLINRNLSDFGWILWVRDVSVAYSDSSLYPTYSSTIKLFNKSNIRENFKSDNNTIRFGHRRTADKDIYFIANRTNEAQNTACTFRASGEPELWSGVDGNAKKLGQYCTVNGNTTIDLEFVPYESYFVVFNRNKAVKNKDKNGEPNFAVLNTVQTIEGPWDVAFDPKWGGPKKIQFEELQDWTQHEMRGIKYYSGIATYKKTFDIDKLEDKKYFIDLGVVDDMARVRLNGKDMGVVWCAPWRIEISGAFKEGKNELEIEIANRWINRLLGDRLEPDANVRTIKFENGFLGGDEFSAGRYTFTTGFSKRMAEAAELQSSGLLGPVIIKSVVYE